MSTTITCAYVVQTIGQRPVAALQSSFQAVPLDLSLPTLYGLRVTSDSIGAAGNKITRTIALSMVPSSTATITANPPPAGGPIKSFTVTGNGLDYIKPPVLSITDSGNGVNATGFAQLGVFGATQVSGGLNYVTPVVTFSGGELAPGGTQATATATVVGTIITALTITSNGGPYTVPPTITITDVGGGAGASFTPRLGVSAAVVSNAGMNYGVGGATVTVTVTPSFKSKFPDSAGVAKQAAALTNWMTQVFQAQLLTHCIANAPVVA